MDKLTIGNIYKVKGVDLHIQVLDFDDEIIDFNVVNGVNTMFLETKKFKQMFLSGEIKLIAKGY